MSLPSRKTLLVYSAIIPILFIFHSACQVVPSATEEPIPTRDVGEEPPTRLSSPTPDLAAPISTFTRVVDIEPGKLLIGPGPYPTPGPKITPWNQLIDRSLVADLKWETYRGELLGKVKDSHWIYSFTYPDGWHVDSKPSLIQGFVQNIPLMERPTRLDFVKFEIVRLSSTPMIEEGRAIDPNDLIPVEVAGEPGILYRVTQQPGQMCQITAFFQHDGGWLAATGYITLPAADPAALERYSAIIFKILSSFTLSDQVTR